MMEEQSRQKEGKVYEYVQKERKQAGRQVLGHLHYMTTYYYNDAAIYLFLILQSHYFLFCLCFYTLFCFHGDMLHQKKTVPWGYHNIFLCQLNKCFQQFYKVYILFTKSYCASHVLPNHLILLKIYFRIASAFVSLSFFQVQK